MVVSDNLIALEGIVHLYKDPGLSYVGQTLSLGLAVEIDTSTVLIANADFIVDSEVTTAIMLVSHLITCIHLTNFGRSICIYSCSFLQEAT